MVRSLAEYGRASLADDLNRAERRQVAPHERSLDASSILALYTEALAFSGIQ